MFVNGKEQETEIRIDNLYKEILFRNKRTLCIPMIFRRLYYTFSE